MVKLRVRELHKSHGDLVKVMTLEEAKELDFQSTVTILPNGRAIHSFADLLTEVNSFLAEQKTPVEEVEVLRFPPMAGG